MYHGYIRGYMANSCQSDSEILRETVLPQYDRGCFEFSSLCRNDRVLFRHCPFQFVRAAFPTICFSIVMR